MPPPLPDHTEVAVIGAGLAGLACATRLAGAGVEVTVLERADAPGGRVRTDLVDGFRLDRGFQLLNPYYPEARRVLDLAALELQHFPGGVMVAGRGHRRLLADPRRVRPTELPLAAWSGLRAPGGTGGWGCSGRAWTGCWPGRTCPGPRRSTSRGCPDRFARA
jgi:phytoene dehydrogenase-like protein